MSWWAGAEARSRGNTKWSALSCFVLPLSACIKAKGSLLSESRIETVDNCLFVQCCILLLNFNLNCSILCHHCPLYCTMYHQRAVYQNLYQQTSVIKCVPPPCTLLKFIVQEVLCIVICNPTALCPILCTATFLCMHFVSKLRSVPPLYWMYTTTGMSTVLCTI